MRSRRQIRQKLELFYNNVKEKRKGKKMKLQVDLKFLELKIKDLNMQHNIEMFSTSLRSGKAFAAEQKIRELKKRVARLSGQKNLLKLTPKKIIEISTENMNISPSRKYGIASNVVESRSQKDEKFKTLFNMHRLERSAKLHDRLDRYDDKIYERNRKKLSEKLNVGKRAHVLAERIKKKSAAGKFYKETVQNISYFNKKTFYTLRKRKTVHNIDYYWIKSLLADLKKRFLRSELFALKENFV